MRKLLQFAAIGIVALACLSVPDALAQTSQRAKESGSDWPYYGHDPGGMRYSPLKQINRENVATLKVALDLSCRRHF
jgi:quinoprotein glucose dehydrogenase